MSAENEAALAAVRRADERARLLAVMTMPEQATLFPGMRADRAEFYIEQIRAMLYGPDQDAGLQWWNEQMTRRDRRFVCRVARLDVALGERSWVELDAEQRARALAAFAWLREWVNSFHAPMCDYKARAFDPAP